MAESAHGTRLRVLIVDDEPLARARLRALLDEMLLPAAQVVADVAQAAAALPFLARREVDVVLLDVQMPGSDGLQLAGRLREGLWRPAVIFVTAHAEHALQAFEVEAVDYLTKPVRRLRLQEALGRAAQWLGRRAAVAPFDAPAPVQDTLVVHQRGEVLRIPVGEILFLRAEQKYVELRTARASHRLDDSLADLGQRLGDAFLRVHRNALVALGAVAALERRAPLPGDDEADPGEPGQPAQAVWAVRIAPTGESLTVSRRQLAHVRKLLGRPGHGPA